MLRTVTFFLFLFIFVLFGSLLCRCKQFWLGWCTGTSSFFSFLFFQTPEELDDSDFETEDFDSRSRTSVQTEDDQLIAGQSARVTRLSATLTVSWQFAWRYNVALDLSDSCVNEVWVMTLNVRYPCRSVKRCWNAFPVSHIQPYHFIFQSFCLKKSNSKNRKYSKRRMIKTLLNLYLAFPGAPQVQGAR